ncbi:two-component system, OmpR family, sensor histidine kinase VicK [Laceyella tengchongensis]|uniref:histidine kinase n=1 Tax=Laceyella tengchongensis TaxID=574699 RepID=A0AA45WQF2_9BACL|nr:ATP-binding protein [Laceyella tengchongensis]SMP25921.1 two-component system, OmpR family, sensor histidine kinase VicK [Laceyella tengchongensis]
MKKWKQLMNSVQWKLVVIYILLIIMAMQLVGVYFIRQLESVFINDLRAQLKEQGYVLSLIVSPELEAKAENDRDRAKRLRARLLQAAPNTSQHFTIVRVIDQNNWVIASNESNEKIFKLPNRLTDLMDKKQPFAKVKDAEGNDYQVYVTKLLDRQQRELGSLYLEAPLKPTYDRIYRISKILIKIAAVALAVTGFLVIILARTITLPIKEIREQTKAMASGDFDRQVAVKSEDEIGQLAISFNDLAAHLRTAIKEKEEETEKLESVLANMSDGVIATDLQGKIIVKNIPAEKLLDRQIALGSSITEVLSLSEPLKLPLKEARQTFVEHHHADAETQTVLKINFTPIKLKGNDLIGMVAVLEDVTEQEKLDRQRKDFVANVSHELRTPLTTIKSYIEALEDGAVEDPELAVRFLKVARQEADRMTRLIQDLLHLSRLDARKSKFYKKPLVLTEILEETMDRFRFQCQQKQISFTLFTHGSLPRVYADPDKLMQVLDNLVSNAIKYTPEGGSVAIVAKRNSDGMVEVGIADTGIGIPKQDLGRIFERFYRVDKARSRSLGGTGLGLAIAQEIVHAHEGIIAIDSIYQKGTVVTFTLPPVSRR